MSYGEHPDNSNKPGWILLMMAILAAILFAAKARACSSYEECKGCAELSKNCVNQAIMYKLEEISNKLDKPESKYEAPIGPFLIKKEN